MFWNCSNPFGFVVFGVLFGFVLLRFASFHFRGILLQQYTYNVRILERKVTRENATRWRSPPQSQRAPDQPPRPCTIVAQPGIPCGPSRLRSGGPGAPNTRRMKTGVSQEHGMRDGSRPAGHVQSVGGCEGLWLGVVAVDFDCMWAVIESGYTHSQRRDTQK